MPERRQYKKDKAEMAEPLLPITERPGEQLISGTSVDELSHDRKSKRTTKEGHKLVVFPQDSDNLTNEDQISKVFSVDGQRLRRVTAYCTADSYDNRELSRYLKRQRSSNYSTPKKFDEVIYTSYVRNSENRALLSIKGQEPISITTSLQREELSVAVASEVPIGEVFFFDYGVTVIWGLEESDEKYILREIIPFERDKLEANEIQIESFKFVQSEEKAPQLFNDIISLKSGNYMTKMTISHAIAQSVKLTVFEDLIEETIDNTKHLPIMLASQGHINLSRKEITKRIGQLFVMRINVNLVSNVLDIPEIFWYEPSYTLLYKTVRGYLEITQRVEVLNQRCDVVSDLLQMLREHLNNSHGETLEWIIIILIMFEVVIGCTTVCIDILK